MLARHAVPSSSFNIAVPRPVNLPGRTNKANSHSPYTLPSSVSCKSFACHSYENYRGVHQQFPFWLAPSSVEAFTLPAPASSGTPAEGNSPRAYPERGRRRPTSHSPLYSTSFFSHSCALFCAFLHFPKTQLLSFQAIPHSLQKTWGCGGGAQIASGE